MNKKARDNRANQLNPNNSAYWKSRMGNCGKRTQSSTSGYSSYEYSDEEPRFVKKPKRNIFGKIKGDYGWVVCNHSGQYIETFYGCVLWTSYFRSATVFKTEDDAFSFVNRNRDKIQYYKIKCVDLND